MVYTSSITVCCLIYTQFKTSYKTIKSNKAIYTAIYIHYNLHYIISYLIPIILWRTHSNNIQSHHHKSTDKNNTVKKKIKIELRTITNCTKFYHTYCLLYYKGHIWITYKPTMIKVQTKTIQPKKEEIYNYDLNMYITTWWILIAI